MRVFGFLYGLFGYVCGLVALTYAIGFVGDWVVPKTIDSPPVSSDAGPWVNMLLLGLFAVQHSVMARNGFKQWLTGFMPKMMERPTFIYATCICFGLLFWQWRPMPGIIWEIEPVLGRTLLTGLAICGWLLVVLSSFLIDHFDLFGIKHAFYMLRGKEIAACSFRVPGFYRWVRHPLYLGLFVAFWAAPTMTVGRLLFAVLTTVYVLIAVRLEEADLITEHGEDYREYRRRTPMLLPFRSPSEPSTEMRQFS